MGDVYTYVCFSNVVFTYIRVCVCVYSVGAYGIRSLLLSCRMVVWIV